MSRFLHVLVLVSLFPLVLVLAETIIPGIMWHLPSDFTPHGPQRSGASSVLSP